MTLTEITEKLRKLMTHYEGGAGATIGGQIKPPIIITDTTPLFYLADEQSHEDHVARGGAGLDSLDRIELVMSIEEEFTIEITDDEVDRNPQWNTIEGIAAFIQAKKED